PMRRRRWERWRACWRRARWWLAWPGGGMGSGDRLHASHRPRRTPMQPVQLSLIPDPHPAAPETLAGRLPADAVAAAITLLAGVIAKTAIPEGMEVAGDE